MVKTTYTSIFATENMHNHEHWNNNLIKRK
jgi:hypothetical protein